ncbi:MAG TPA: hypothetical protein DEP69_00875, partial [Acidimicrobiaceae bacterium]|nr:hypothetical protein [Acidimicrobiaceae bacterium]
PPPVVVDGSGLDRGNSATCGQLVAVLESFGPDSAVGRALPVAARSGTLSHRFADHPAAGRLSAKTGLLTGVNSLAGFLKTPTGMLTFAQIVNGVPPDSRVGLESQETLVEALLGHPADCSTAVALLDAPWSSAAAASAAALSPAPATGITPQPCIVVPAPPEPPASEEPDPADTSTTDPSAQE